MKYYIAINIDYEGDYYINDSCSNVNQLDQDEETFLILEIDLPKPKKKAKKAIPVLKVDYKPQGK